MTRRHRFVTVGDNAGHVRPLDPSTTIKEDLVARSPFSNLRRLIGTAVTVVVVAVLAGCGDDDDNDDGATVTTTPGAATATSARAVSESDRAAIEDVLDASSAAEGTGDAAAFVALWTDRGLEQYGLGTREKILANGFGADERPGDLVGEPAVTVTGDKAAVTADIRAGIGVYRIGFALVRDGDGWLIDGFEFQGGAPTPEGVPVVEVTAVDFAFGFVRDALASGQFALHFNNIGTQQHEMVLFRVPDDATVANAGAALAGVDASSYEGAPAGYEVVDHLVYAEPGESTGFTFAERLPAGHYMFACYIPVGGFNRESGQPVVPGAEPHIARGMIADFTVA
jgi:hypothetical protein